MKILLWLLAPVVCLAQIRPSIVSTMKLVSKYTPAGGDTVFYNVWTQADDVVCPDGKFEGGCIFGTFNDGRWTGADSLRSIAIMRLDSFDSSNIDRTSLTEIAAMDYADGNCTSFGRPYNAYSAGMWAVGTTMYLAVMCQNVSADYKAVNAGIVMSPDGWKHSCNYTTYQAHSTGHACDASNWVEGIDFPKSQAAFQWPGNSGDYSNKMEYLSPVLFPCQGGIDCPVAPGVDPAFRYFLTQRGDRAFVSAHRYMDDPMLPANWSHYNKGAWDSEPHAASAISGGCPNLGIQQVMWLPHFHKFGYVAQLNSTSACFATASLPWGRYKSRVKFTNPITGQFPNMLPGTYRYVHGHVQVVLATNEPDGRNLQLQVLDLGRAKPMEQPPERLGH